jgi:hypothetical protein
MRLSFLFAALAAFIFNATQAVRVSRIVAAHITDGTRDLAASIGVTIRASPRAGPALDIDAPHRDTTRANHRPITSSAALLARTAAAAPQPVPFGGAFRGPPPPIAAASAAGHSTPASIAAAGATGGVTPFARAASNGRFLGGGHGGTGTASLHLDSNPARSVGSSSIFIQPPGVTIYA